MSTMGERIKLSRESKNLFQSELAKLVGYLESEIDIEKEQAQALRNSFNVIRIDAKTRNKNKF